MLKSYSLASGLTKATSGHRTVSPNPQNFLKTIGKIKDVSNPYPSPPVNKLPKRPIQKAGSKNMLT